MSGKVESLGLVACVAYMWHVLDHMTPGTFWWHRYLSNLAIFEQYGPVDYQRWEDDGGPARREASCAQR